MTPDAISKLCFGSAGSQAFLKTLHFCCHRGGYAKTTAPDLIHLASGSGYFPGSRCAFRDAEIEDGGTAFDVINDLPAVQIRQPRIFEKQINRDCHETEQAKEEC